MDKFYSFSEFGVKQIQQIIQIILPDGHPLVKDWFMMKWWHVAFFSLAYPFLMGNIRVYRFENHPKPIHAFSTIGLFFTAFSAIVYLLILFEIFSYYSGEPILSCHTVDFSVKNVRVKFYSSVQYSKIASVLWFFHVSRVFFDLINTIQSALTKPVHELRTEQSINEIRFTLTHFIVWWMILLYSPGGEVLYPVATCCMFYLGTIACALSPGKFISLKMFLWIILVVANFVRIGFNLFNGCRFPSAILTISPPYDINTNVHMIIFYFLSYLPAGFIFHYMLYARGAVCTWWAVLIFIICAHWPSSTEEKEVDPDASLALVSSSKISKKEKREKARKKKIEKLKEERQLFHLPSNVGEKLVYGEGTKEPVKQKSSSNGTHKMIHSNPMLRKCSRAMCTNYEKRPKEFKVCERCRSPYCGIECQKLDWQANHKMYCKQKKLD